MYLCIDDLYTWYYSEALGGQKTTRSIDFDAFRDLATDLTGHMTVLLLAGLCSLVQGIAILVQEPVPISFSA